MREKVVSPQVTGITPSPVLQRAASARLQHQTTPAPKSRSSGEAVAGGRAPFSFANVAIYPGSSTAAESGVIQRAATRSEQDATKQAPASDGSGRPIPDSVRGQMESSFGADFSSVRVHEGDSATAASALAYTRGEEIHFAPGQYRPGTQAGDALLGHELTHVVQQRAGRVPMQQARSAGGVCVNADPALEGEAERLGARAARGESVTVQGATSRAAAASSAGAPGVIQRAAVLVGRKTNTKGKPIDLSDRKRREKLISAANMVGSGNPMKFFVANPEEDRQIIETMAGPEPNKAIEKNDHIDVFGHSSRGYPAGFTPDVLVKGIKRHFTFNLQRNEKWQGDMRIFSCHGAQNAKETPKDDTSATVHEMAERMGRDSKLGGVKGVGGTIPEGGLHPEIGLVTGLTGSNSRLRSLLQAEKRVEAYKALITRGSLDEFAKEEITITVGAGAKKKTKIVKPQAEARAMGFGSFVFSEDEKEFAKTASLVELQAMVATAFNKRDKADWRIATKTAQGWKLVNKPLVGAEPGQVERLGTVPVRITAEEVNRTE